MHFLEIKDRETISIGVRSQVLGIVWVFLGKLRGYEKQQEEMNQMLNVLHGVFTYLLEPSPTPGRNINEKNLIKLACCISKL